MLELQVPKSDLGLPSIVCDHITLIFIHQSQSGDHPGVGFLHPPPNPKLRKHVVLVLTFRKLNGEHRASRLRYQGYLETSGNHFQGFKVHVAM